MTGIILVPHLQITLVGLHQKRLNPSTTHVQPVGVFLMEEAMVSGQRHVVQVQTSTTLTTAPKKAWTSPASSAQHPPSGILLRVVATTTMAVSAVSATSATIGLLLLTVTFTTPTTCTSTTLAASMRRAATIARTAGRSVVSKNQNSLISVVRKPKRKQGFLDNAFCGLPLGPGPRPIRREAPDFLLQLRPSGNKMLYLLPDGLVFSLSSYD